jgi:hypothetical protein
MWKFTLVMISFAGIGEGLDDGLVVGVGDSAGGGAALGVVATDDVASGEVVASWLGWVQPAMIKIKPATHAAGATPLFTRL